MTIRQQDENASPEETTTTNEENEEEIVVEKEEEPEIVVEEEPDIIVDKEEDEEDLQEIAVNDENYIEAPRQEADEEHDPPIHSTTANNIYSETTISSSLVAVEQALPQSQPQSFPAPFYCPITRQLLEDPVVPIDGVSYERSALLGEDHVDDAFAQNVYPNRALKQVMDETIEMAGPGLRAGMMRLQHTVRKSLLEALDKSVIPSEEYRPLPELYYCPITFNLIHDPVIDPEGNTFERVAVENWIQVNGTSPITRTPCTLSQLRPNHAIKELLDLEKNKNETSIHPSIRKWKEESPPQATDPELGGNIIASSSNDHGTNSGLGFASQQHPSLPGGPYASTEAELLAERRARARCAFSLVALFFTIFFFVLFFMYGGFGLLFLGILCCNYACRFSGGDHRDE